MARAWRIVRRARMAEAFSGEGARQFGGRWNLRGIAVVYTSEHLSLAALELLVHLHPRRSLEFVAFELQIPDELIAALPAADLPAHWRAEPPGGGTMHIGDAWVRRGESAALAVPSTIVPEELNYLLNPGHPDYPRIVIQSPCDFSFDPRLITERAIP